MSAHCSAYNIQEDKQGEILHMKNLDMMEEEGTFLIPLSPHFLYI